MNGELDFSGLYAGLNEELEELLEDSEQKRAYKEESYKKVGELIGSVGSQGLKISSVLGVLNPQMGALASQIENVGKFAVDTYNKLYELANSLSNLNASMQILNLDTSSLDSVSELAEDMAEINTLWSDFIYNVKKDLLPLIDGVDNIEELKAWLNPLGKISESISQEIIEGILGEVDKSVISSYINNQVDNDNVYAGVLEKQLRNINSQGLLSEELLNKVAVSLGSNFISKGLLTSDSNLYSADYLGMANKVANQLGITDQEQYISLIKAMQKYSTSFNNSGLSAYGLGISEEYIYGYANTHGKDFSMLSNSEQIKLADEALKAYIDASEEERIAMSQLGFELKNNTSAIQSWQYLETLGGKSSEYVGADANNFLAVNKSNEIITNELFGSVEDRQEMIDQNNELINKAEKIYNALVSEKSGAKTVDEWVKYNAKIKGLDANIINAPSTAGSDRSLDAVIEKNKKLLSAKSLDEMIMNNAKLMGIDANIINAPSTVGSGLSLDEVVEKNKENMNINMDISTSPLFDIYVENKINEILLNVKQKSYQR